MVLLLLMVLRSDTLSLFKMKMRIFELKKRSRKKRKTTDRVTAPDEHKHTKMVTIESQPVTLPEGEEKEYTYPVCVRPSKYGRGVFAVRRIRAGELFDTAPMVRSLWPSDDTPAMNETMLSDYVYAWIHSSREAAEDTPAEELAMPEYVASALGFGSYYNHSFTPNAVYVRRKPEDLMDYVALRDIEAGEEILVNYNCDPSDTTPLWFPTF